MIPLQLCLRNFMSYGDEPTTLDFTGWQIACLSGSNGHGKSALFDAMTWALWGRCRAKREDDVVRQGATNGEVEFEFAVGGSEYRVVRKRTLRRSTGQTTLELHVRHDGEWRTATGATVNETQAALIAILRLSYDTFINSAFLMQGRADEFTTKAPNERKKVLGEILGLGRYDDLTERARGLARERENDVSAARARLDELDMAIASRAAVETEERETERQVGEADVAYLRASAEMGRLEERRQEQDRLAKALATLAARSDEVAALKAREEGQRARLDTFIARCEALIARSEEITRGYAELQAARDAFEQVARAGRQAHDLQMRIHALERAISAQEDKVRRQVARERESAAARRGLAARLPALSTSMGEIGIQVAALPRLEQDLADLRGRREALKADTTMLEAEHAALGKQRDGLRDRLKLLKSADAACPICRTPLDLEGRQRVEQEYVAEGTGIKAQQAALDARIGALRDDAARHDGAEPELQAKLARLRQAEGRLESLRTQAREAQEAEAQAQEFEQRAAALEATLGTAQIAPEERTELARLQQEFALLGYDAAGHDQAQQYVHALGDRQGAYDDLRKAVTELAHRQEQRAGLQESLARYAVEQERLAQEQEEIRSRALDAAALSAQLLAATATRDEVEATRSRLQQRLGNLRGHLKRIEEQSTERATLAEAHGLLEREASAYRDLGQAFGRQGIQAMLIDAALPEIENVANEILARMTDNSVHVQFSTQRTGVSGNVVETLDIRISDSAGTRSYEMFSGGEAFRVNFAVRVALSRLLAARAGASLQTLIIDEGFGSQDGAGRERLIDAITSIAGDFQKILVITHLEELKEFFPVHIEVVKGLAGSRISITE